MKRANQNKITAREASKPGSSVLALKEWGEAVEESVNKDE